MEAIREIVLNMILHRDNRIQSDSIVKIFDDKIEFYNPGKLHDEISVEDLVKNNYKSTPRNKSIAEFFKNIGWIEKYGSGIGRIINYFKEANLHLPTFENHSGGFLVTVFARNKEETKENVTENVTEKRRQYILQLIEENHNITTTEIAELAGVVRRTIARDIDFLKDKGILLRVGSDRKGHWKLVKRNE